MGKHAHAQIQYIREDGESVETLWGFNPTSEEDRKFLHDSLDEYLDRYLVPLFRGEVPPVVSVREDPLDRPGFRVFDCIDSK